jgi:hypothetical protein
VNFSGKKFLLRPLFPEMANQKKSNIIEGNG